MKRALVGFVLTCSMVGCGISQQQEVQMGVEYAQQINAQLPIIQDPELNRYINVLGDSIARLTSRADLDWHFFIVDSKDQGEALSGTRLGRAEVPQGFVLGSPHEGRWYRDKTSGAVRWALGHPLAEAQARVWPSAVSRPWRPYRKD